MKTIHGIIPPLVTPLTDREELDRDGLARLVEHVIKGGVHGVFVLGTTGEGPSLSHAIRRETVAAVCQFVRGRVPVIVNATDPVYSESVSLSRFSASQGAAAVVVAPPFFFPLARQEMRSYFLRFAVETELPFYLYNLPSLTKMSIDENTLRACCELPNFRGIKDSSADMGYFKRTHRLIREYPNAAMYIGPEELLLDSLMAGGNGGVSGGANVWPELYVDLFEKYSAGDLSGAKIAQERILEISAQVYSLGGYGATVTRPLKGALEILGICHSTMASPLLQWDKSELAKLKTVMVGLPALSSISI